MNILKMGLFLSLTLLAVHKVHADELNVAIEQAAKTYKVSPDIMRAIASIESSNQHGALRKNKNGTYDFGAFQINSVHWGTTCKHFNVALIQGNANCAALLLSKAKARYKADQNWYGGYHSRTPSKKSHYATLVRKYLQVHKDGYKLYVKKDGVK